MCVLSGDEHNQQRLAVQVARSCEAEGAAHVSQPENLLGVDLFNSGGLKEGSIAETVVDNVYNIDRQQTSSDVCALERLAVHLHSMATPRKFSRLLALLLLLAALTIVVDAVFTVGGVYTVGWTQNADDNTITFSLTTTSSVGWVGVGLNSAAQMQGADMYLGYVTSTGTAVVVDAYASVGHVRPTPDNSLGGGASHVTGVSGTRVRWLPMSGCHKARTACAHAVCME